MILSLTFTATTAYFGTLRLRTYLHAFQQEEYDNPRLLKWWKEKHAFDRWTSLGLLIAAPFGLFQPAAPTLAAALWLGWKAREEPNPTLSAKKALVLTTRAKKIWYLASLLTLPVVGALATAPLHASLQALLTVVFIQSLPLFLIIANTLLAPLQKALNRRYLTQAKTILGNIRPTTIGITGSFGKTSTKYLLNHILASQAPTLATPGSVNTLLGISRIVREHLQPQHQYFISEMGAYGPGSIAALCSLTPPDISCITAIGQAHYERFKSLETVARAKFEIAEATLARGGICILNADAIPDDLWQPRVSKAPQSYRLVTSRKDVLREGDYYIENPAETPKGLTLTLRHKGEATTLSAPVHGKVQVGNIAVAFAMAKELGLKTKTITGALATAQPAPYRLNIQQVGEQTILDDTYNANPTGFATALETLTLLAHAEPKSPRRRILITPGMVELGAAHDAEHARLGTLAARHADIILAIAPERMPTFLQAVHKTQVTLHTFPSLAAARNWMQSNGRPNDVILLANDLPDRYEARWTL